MERAKFVDADLREADLSQVHGLGFGYGSDFSRANLQGATLRRAGLIGVKFINADFRNADLRGARFGLDLQGADFQGADLRGASLLGCNLIGARFEDALLEGTEMIGVITSEDVDDHVEKMWNFLLLGARAVDIEPEP